MVHIPPTPRMATQPCAFASVYTSNEKKNIKIKDLIVLVLGTAM
jgi:hypothetical protein